MQSNLQKIYTDPAKPFQTVTRYVMALYLGLCGLATLLYFSTASPATKAFALGLFAPGTGFVFLAGGQNSWQVWAVLAALACAAAFALALVIWFATGNALAPPLVWLASAIAASSSAALTGLQSAHTWPGAFGLVAGGTAMTLALVLIANKALTSRRKRPTPAALAQTQIDRLRQNSVNELDETMLRHLRYLLDRALQPIDRFDGFEQLDQFQTSALRYQLNFISYALSIAQATHMPAFAGYMLRAQQNLAAKQQLHHIWRYWKLENMWGNLRLDADPVPKGNIMYTGFVAAQLAYFQAASGSRQFLQSGSFTCRTPRGQQFAYSLPAMAKLLTSQYRTDRFGLLECEPNWVYPLCNAITATAIRACDTQQGTRNWDAISERFLTHLKAGFIDGDGQFVPIRSKYLGFAMPRLGGAVMQAFPCLFLNPLYPELAAGQWALFRHRLSKQNWSIAFWPIDVGNYRPSRASSYAATLAAAVEMGDHGFADQLREKLGSACPSISVGQGARLKNASLWANAVYVMAQAGRTGMLNRLVNHAPPALGQTGPCLESVPWPDVQVARAVNRNGTLECVLYPGKINGLQPITIGGLNPARRYELSMASKHPFAADSQGKAQLNIRLYGRTELTIHEAR